MLKKKKKKADLPKILLVSISGTGELFGNRNTLLAECQNLYCPLQHIMTFLETVPTSNNFNYEMQSF